MEFPSERREEELLNSRHDQVHNGAIHLLYKCREESKDEKDWRINRTRCKVEYKNIIGRNAI